MKSAQLRGARVQKFVEDLQRIGEIGEWPREVALVAFTVDEMDSRQVDGDSAAVRDEIALLAQHFCPKGPNENEEIVRLSESCLLLRNDGDLRARGDKAVLLRIRIADRGHQLPTDAAVVEDDVALRGCPVSQHGLARGFREEQEMSDLISVREDSLAEALIRSISLQRRLSLEHVGDSR